MNGTDFKQEDKVAKLHKVFEEVEVHLKKNIDLQGHIQINFFSGHASNWSALQVFQGKKRGK